MINLRSSIITSNKCTQRRLLSFFNTKHQHGNTFTPRHDIPKVTNIWEYAVSNGFATTQQEFKEQWKEESEAAIQIIRVLAS
jgi:hypothetical protein